jgi:putative transposase
LNKVLKRLHYPLDVTLTCVRWYVADPLSLRHVEEMMQERGVFVDHSTVHRLAIKVFPVMATVFRRRKRPVGGSWRMDEAYIKVAGHWKYLYRAVDRAGETVDFRQNKYLNNIVEQDHRSVKRVTQPMLGLKSFWSARILIGGIETMHMIKKGQMNCPVGLTMSPAQQFYSLSV